MCVNNEILFCHLACIDLICIGQEEAVAKVSATYKVSDIKTVEDFSAKKTCAAECKKACCANKDKKTCEPGCKKACCQDGAKASDKIACKADCKKACCAKKEA